MNPKHIMVDLETLGTDDNSAILQIGAVRFDPNTGAISTAEGWFRQKVQLTCPFIGKIDADTVRWWMTQDKEAQRRVFTETPHDLPLPEALDAFAQWVQDQGGVDTVWANSPSFDLKLLQQAWHRCPTKEDYPFPFWKEMDFRTVKKIGQTLGVPQPIFTGVKHDALDDAYRQAIWCSNILQSLRKK